MKKYLILMVAIVLITTTISFAEVSIEELNSNIGIDSSLIEISKNKDGSLKSISYIISSTRLNNNSTTTYQTSEIHITLGTETYTVPTSVLKDKINPGEKDGKVWHMVTISAENIEENLSSEMDKNLLEHYLQNPENIEIGAKISIMKNGKEIDNITNINDVASVARKWGFNNTHFEDMRSRFRPVRNNNSILGDPVQDEETPRTGLRPTSIRDESIREKGD